MKKPAVGARAIIEQLEEGMGISNKPKRKPKPEMIQEIARPGRIALWAICPPLGLWRSVKHGQRKRDDRLAKKIRGES